MIENCLSCKNYKTCATSSAYILPKVKCRAYKRKKIKEDYLIYWIILAIKNKFFKLKKTKENIIKKINIRIIEHKLENDKTEEVTIGIGESLSLYNPEEKEHEIFKLIYTPNTLFLETFSEEYIKKLKQKNEN
jgi:hypothetical protein